ncbi:MAG: decaprenyl-phosphate phosphoribosyltransferase, partial [Caldilineae bacterium]
MIGLVRTMRIKQWTKNAFVLAGVVFDGKLLDPEMVVRALVAFIGFCFASSAVYLFNDLVDMEKDRQHPRKRLRPLPAGQLNPRLAAFASALLAVAAVGGVMALDFWTGVIVLSYLLLNVAYSFQLKHLVIIDVMMIA